MKFWYYHSETLLLPPNHGYSNVPYSRYKFKAQELNPKILEGGPILPKKPPVKEPTKIVGFNLEIEKRIQQREKKDEEEEMFIFHSRPCPTKILHDVVVSTLLGWRGATYLCLFGWLSQWTSACWQGAVLSGLSAWGNWSSEEFFGGVSQCWTNLLEGHLIQIQSNHATAVVHNH